MTQSKQSPFTIKSFEKDCLNILNADGKSRQSFTIKQTKQSPKFVFSIRPDKVLYKEKNQAGQEL